jgi:hypothetical protein
MNKWENWITAMVTALPQMVNTVFLLSETLKAFRKNATRTIVTETENTRYTEPYHKEGTPPNMVLGRKTIKAQTKLKACKERVTLDRRGSFLNHSLKPLTKWSTVETEIAFRRKTIDNGAKK